jgi:hypothetical protein
MRSYFCTLASWLQHMPALPRLLLKFSNTHNSWSVGPKIMKYVLPWSLLRDACSEKVPKNLKRIWDQVMLLKSGLATPGTFSTLGVNWSRLDSHVALSHVLPFSHVLSWFPTLKFSSLHLVIFRHPYLAHTKSSTINVFCYEFSTSFPSHLPFGFLLEEPFFVFRLWEDSLE